MSDSLHVDFGQVFNIRKVRSWTIVLQHLDLCFEMWGFAIYLILESIHSKSRYKDFLKQNNYLTPNVFSNGDSNLNFVSGNEVAQTEI